MVRYMVTISYMDRDGCVKRCTISKWAASPAEAQKYALEFFFRPEERDMVLGVDVVEEGE